MPSDLFQMMSQVLNLLLILEGEICPFHPNVGGDGNCHCDLDLPVCLNVVDPNSVPSPPVITTEADYHESPLA